MGIGIVIRIIENIFVGEELKRRTEQMKRRRRLNKRGAVNSYRFIAMYIIIGIICGMVTAFAQSNTNTEKAYDLKANDRLNEIASTSEKIYSDSETLVQANQFQLSNSFGDERALGMNWVGILKNGFMPTGLIPKEELSKATEMEKGLNSLLTWFRVIILIFAGYELFQMLLRKVT